MIRTFSIFLAAVFLGKLTSEWNDGVGFYFAVILFVLIEMTPRAVMMLMEKKVKNEILKWAQENGLAGSSIEHSSFKNRERKLRVSDVQLVYFIKGSSKESAGTAYYAVCGSWLLGLLSKKIVIYKAGDHAKGMTVAYNRKFHGK